MEVESDSKLICSWWQYDSEVIWTVRDAWDQAKAFANHVVIQVHHAYHEISHMVGGLAKIGDQGQSIDILEIHDFPVSLRMKGGMLRLDKFGLPYLRCK